MQINTFFPEVFRRHKNYVIAIGTFVVGILLGILIMAIKPKAQITDVRSSKSSYTFINPLLECQNVSFENNDNLNSLEREINHYLDEAAAEGKISTASIYYRDLNNGPWFDINREEEFSPASLIKVPLMIAIYKVSETDPSFLQKTITINEDVNYEDQNFVPKELLVKGKTYTIKDLMERMIIDSDNNAYDILLKVTSLDTVIQVYNDLGIDIQKLNDGDPSGDILTINNYATFFRVLFNASYISRKNSEEALSILSRSSYEDGLVAGTPAETPVAHKYGERYFTFSGIRQLHDCGIVYNSKSPYLLCIMTKGRDFEQLESVIMEVTKMIDERHSQTVEQ